MTPIQNLIRATRELIAPYGYELHVTQLSEDSATWVILAPWPTVPTGQLLGLFHPN